ncbi:MAG TPA: hypothetical protein VF173_12130 [Thermoanaerobaculia bacterium]|nr:hypothetical protein [Thermoanaerobaculia bacterium]
MNKTFRLALLLGFAFLASWTSTPRPAHAIPSCESLASNVCTVPNSDRSCVWSDGNRGSCSCSARGQFWNCIVV